MVVATVILPIVRLVGLVEGTMYPGPVPEVTDWSVPTVVYFLAYAVDIDVSTEILDSISLDKADDKEESPETLAEVSTDKAVDKEESP